MATSTPSALVIEDNPEVLAPMTKFAGDQFDSAGTVEQARWRLLTKPLRAIVFDLRLPDASGLQATEFGLQLLANHAPPLARVFVYTGFRNTDEGLAAIDLGGEGGFWVLAKGARNAAEMRTATATPLGCSALLLHHLGKPLPDSWGPLKREAQNFLRELETKKPLATEPWHRSYWRQARHHLPLPLSEAAARYIAAVEPDATTQEVIVGREGLLALNDFREWTVWLAAAQTAVILRQQGALKRGTVQAEAVRAAHEWLDGQLPALCALPPQAAGALAWKNHLGAFARPAPSRGSIGYSTGLEALEALRRTRNEGVHGLKPKAVAEGELAMLPPIMDLASFWASNPLLAQVRRERGRWRARALGGKENADRDLPEGLELPIKGVDSGRIYQLVWRFSGDGPADGDEWLRLGRPVPVLLDWWPYLRWNFNRELGANEAVLLTGPERAGGVRWHAQGFAGSVRKPELTPEETRALTQLPG